MNALLSILKWAGTTFLIPLINKWVAAWIKSREVAAKLKEKIKGNQTKTEAYEKDPSDDNFSKLP